MKKILTAVAALMLMGSAAQAATTFSFTNGTRDLTSRNLNYSQDDIDLGVSASRYSNSVVDDGKIGQIGGTSGGLYINNSRKKQISGSGKKEVAVFQFSENVILESIKFVGFGSFENFAFFFDSNNDGNFDFVQKGLTTRDKHGRYTFLDSLLKTGNRFAIGALGAGDAFKIDSITVSKLSVVPLPAGLPLYGAGLAVLGFIGWRRKRKMAAAA